LNEADLGVDPRRVHRAWLRDTIERRIQDDSTRVIGPPGEPRCKLDLGSIGPCGWMLEGVFTFPDHRGRGLATGLVATVAAAAPAPLVCLHVDAGNAPAIAAYRRAGMRRLGACRLLLQRG
jgi:GNAT superfamily N-acetyltransferase